MQSARSIVVVVAAVVVVVVLTVLSQRYFSHGKFGLLSPDYRIFNVRTDVNACILFRTGCTDTVRESALKFEAWRKILCRTGESNLHQQRAGPTLYQLS